MTIYSISRSLDALLLAPKHREEKQELLCRVDQLARSIIYAECPVCLSSKLSVILHPAYPEGSDVHSVCIRCILQPNMVKHFHQKCLTCRQNIDLRDHILLHWLPSEEEQQRRWLVKHEPLILQRRHEILEVLSSFEILSRDDPSLSHLLPPNDFSSNVQNVLIARVFKEDGDVIFHMVRTHCIAFSSISEEFRGDYDIALHGIATDWRNLQHASLELRNNFIFVGFAMSLDFQAFQYAGPALRLQERSLRSQAAREAAAMSGAYLF